MIAYPCKQDPTPGHPNLAWNHKWFYDEPIAPITTGAAQLIKVYQSDTNLYCLRSPGVLNQYVTFQTGCSTADRHFAWTRTGDVGTFDGSFTFTDGYGFCLAVDTTDLLPKETWATLKVQKCDYGLAQKWNAPSIPTPGSLGSYWELP
jgi:hypothetical protein